jgi:hypothetical protein
VILKLQKRRRLRLDMGCCDTEKKLEYIISSTGTCTVIDVVYNVETNIVEQHVIFTIKCGCFGYTVVPKLV